MNSVNLLLLEKMWTDTEGVDDADSLLEKWTPVMMQQKTNEVKRLQIRTEAKAAPISHHHTGVKPFECPLCDYKTTNKGRLVIHQRSHTGEKPLECTLCDFKTAYKDHLKEHQLRHTGAKPFECHLCRYTTVRKSTLRRHYKRDSHWRYSI